MSQFVRWLRQNNFKLNDYGSAEGKLWERRTGRWSCLQVDEGMTTFIVCEDAVVYVVTKEQFKQAVNSIKK